MSRTPHQKITRLDAADEPVYRDPTKKRIDPAFVPPSCADLAAIRRAVRQAADEQRGDDPMRDLRRACATSRCAICGVELVGEQRTHMFCEKHRKGFGTGKAAGTRFDADYLPLAAFEMSAYVWQGER